MDIISSLQKQTNVVLSNMKETLFWCLQHLPPKDVAQALNALEYMYYG
jgi:hypothetical protein